MTSLIAKLPITVYADISCPFCFVLHERLLTLSQLENVHWRTIEHAPGANSHTRDPRQISQLNDEYRLILKRGEEVKVINPGFIPNTLLVNRYLMAIEQYYPEKLIACRTAIYRALWQQGKDISQIKVLEALLLEQGVASVAFDAMFEERLARWQRKWQFADFDMRIPVMLRDKTEVMLGLQHSKSIMSFINFQSIKQIPKGDLCQYISKDVVLVLYQAQKPDLTVLSCQDKSSLHFYQQSGLLIQDLLQRSADLVLIDVQVQNSFELCQQIKSLGGDYAHLPVIYYGQGEDRQLEQEAFNTGASDFICLATQSDGLAVRVKSHIRLKHQLDILSDHAAHDGLTGLYNKREFENCLEREWRLACRHKKPLGMLMLDIDHFKAFNDHYGHPAGDEALVKVANSISNCVFRGTDLAARYGGEEFVVILPNTDETSLVAIATRIQQSIENLNIRHEYSPTSAILTASIGLALTQAHADNNYLMLIEVADQCLYQSKGEGRNQVNFSQLATPSY